MMGHESDLTPCDTLGGGILRRRQSRLSHEEQRVDDPWGGLLLAHVFEGVVAQAPVDCQDTEGLKSTRDLSREEQARDAVLKDSMRVNGRDPK